MPFQIRYKTTADGSGAYTTVTLSPSPTEVDYPERRLMKVNATQDGANVVQRPLRDSRPRKWVWKGYTTSLTVYENQWTLLKTLEYRTRLGAVLWPIVEVLEDVVVEGGFASWIKVKLLRVERVSRKGGGNLIYDESFLEFVVDDASYTGF